VVVVRAMRPTLRSVVAILGTKAVLRGVVAVLVAETVLWIAILLRVVVLSDVAGLVVGRRGLNCFGSGC